jgi:hypothetical protein
MADKPLFNLDAEGRWRLAYDRQQWVLQRRDRAPRRSEYAGIADPGCKGPEGLGDGNATGRASTGRCIHRSGWKGISFIGSKKRVLRRVLGEKGVILTAEAQARLDALPDNFLAFIAAPERFFARPEAEAA